MPGAQTTLLLIIVLTLILFAWGRLRHDIVALSALMVAVVAGVVPADNAFVGFAHPAVITVACVLVLSQALRNTGAIDALARKTLPQTSNRLVTLTSFMAVGATLSAFMNNVGAMALLLPLSGQIAKRLDLAPGQVLMPLAFGTILGGMTTLIGTPPNLIVSGFRETTGRPPFAMFDYAFVGLGVAVLGITFIALVGWRLVPVRRPAIGDDFETTAYLTEVSVPEGSPAVGLTIRAFEREIEDSDAQVIALIRNDVRMTAPHGGRRISPTDILVLEADVEALTEAISVFQLQLAQNVASEQGADEDSGETEDKGDTTAEESEIEIREMVVLPGASVIGHNASDLNLRTRYGVNLLALGREARQPQRRLRSIRFKAGDILLIQGPSISVRNFLSDSGCAPLFERELRIPERRTAIASVALLIGAVALTVLGLLPTPVAFMLGVLGSVLLRTIPLKQLYTAIDWPVIVLLAALIPVAQAMQDTGAAERVAGLIVDGIAGQNAILALAVILIATMFLSDVLNNAATAAVMCPIAIGIAASLGVNSDTFLMAVAIGASCAFLTPIGHQNNTLILGPGGFRFGDYWRLGLPVEALVVALSLPLLLTFWPL